MWMLSLNGLMTIPPISSCFCIISSTVSIPIVIALASGPFLHSSSEVKAHEQRSVLSIQCPKFECLLIVDISTIWHQKHPALIHPVPDHRHHAIKPFMLLQCAGKKTAFLYNAGSCKHIRCLFRNFTVFLPDSNDSVICLKLPFSSIFAILASFLSWSRRSRSSSYRA